MAKCKIEYDFSRHDIVSIKDIDTKGRVISLISSVDGKQYLVKYWNNGELKTVWLYEWEMEIVNEN